MCIKIHVLLPCLHQEVLAYQFADNKDTAHHKTVICDRTLEKCPAFQIKQRKSYSMYCGECWIKAEKERRDKEARNTAYKFRKGGKGGKGEKGGKGGKGKGRGGKGRGGKR
jgi:hypothetical protein